MCKPIMQPCPLKVKVKFGCYKFEPYYSFNSSKCLVKGTELMGGGAKTIFGLLFECPLKTGFTVHTLLFVYKDMPLGL